MFKKVLVYTYPRMSVNFAGQVKTRNELWK